MTEPHLSEQGPGGYFPSRDRRQSQSIPESPPHGSDRCHKHRLPASPHSPRSRPAARHWSPATLPAAHRDAFPTRASPVQPAAVPSPPPAVPVGPFARSSPKCHPRRHGDPDPATFAKAPPPVSP